jgi:regulator of cell morphogenesis and NO signaling
VRNNYRAADVFKKWGIDYCCGGDVPLAVACAQHQADPAAVQHELDLLAGNLLSPEIKAAAEWPLEFLIDYLVHVHHAYLKRELPLLRNMLRGFVHSHRQSFPHLREVEDVFNDLAAELADHNQQEEDSIFPYLKQIIGTHRRKETYGSLFVRALGRPLGQKVSADHNRIAALQAHLRTVTNGYHFSDDACISQQVIYQKLKELDENLKVHKHLENNILYPNVLQMEQELLQV